MDKYAFDAVELSLMERSCIPLAVYQFIDRRVVTCALSDGFCRLFGYGLDEAYHLMDHDMYRDTHPDDVARIGDAAIRFATGEDEKYDVVYRTWTSDGYKIIHAFGEHVYTESGVRLAVVWYNDEGAYDEMGATEANNAVGLAFGKALREETLYHQSHYDRLTGLPSMTYFFELADAGRSRMAAEGKTPALVFVNLTGMKHFNRKHGFSEGDKLIGALARILVRHFSNENCSRLGEDHFAVYADSQGLDETLQAIIDEVATLNEGNTLPVRIGVYLDSTEGVDIGLACDRAKYASDFLRDTYVSGYRYFENAMLVRAENERYVLDNIDRAIAEGWIEVYYQPIVRAANGMVCDEEALARWIDPQRGLLSPAEFIPALEGANLIYKLDLCVLDLVLKKMRTQEEAGLYVVPNSINLSRTDFDGRDLVEEVRKRVDAAGVGRDKITIEITESAVGSDLEFIREQVERFRALGFSVWMDDFGSGYSSLDVLQDIQFDLIKLDMRFMKGFAEGDKSKIILTELVRMALSLGVDTVAEGVETKEQVDFLREIGCSRLQGFYFSKPVPHATIMDRASTGELIGFEDPAEAEYYASIGRINLYDFSSVAHDDMGSFTRYFDTMPMAIVEATTDQLWIARCNRTYRKYMERMFAVSDLDKSGARSTSDKGAGETFFRAIRQCAIDGHTVIIDEEECEGETTHAIIRRVAVNSVSGTAAMVVAILAITETKGLEQPVTYARVAQALSTDYRSLYYVNMSTESFVEFSPTGNRSDLFAERHGEGFFQASRSDALSLLHEDDSENFARLFTRESVLRSLENNGAFTLTYRLLQGEEYRYMHMKAVRMGTDDDHIIIGVSDIDEQMRRQEMLDRIRAEHAAYMRLAALSDDYLCVYIVEVEAESYLEYSAASEYEGIGLAKEGERFFHTAHRESAEKVFADDRERFVRMFTKANILDAIDRSGHFTLEYRLLMAGKPIPVTLKAVLVEEPDAARLVIGVSR